MVAARWQCLRCGHVAPYIESAVCTSCGCECFLPYEKPLPGAKLSELRKQTRGRAIDAPIARALGGWLTPDASILIYGVPGAGKSTEAARLAGELAGPCLFLDREMGEATARATWERAGVSLSRVRRVVPETGTEAVDAARSMGARVVVVDSVQMMPGGWRTVARLRTAARRLILVSQVNAKGKPAGSMAGSHWVEAVCEVEKARVVGKKCRWAIEQTADRPPLPDQTERPRSDR